MIEFLGLYYIIIFFIAGSYFDLKFQRVPNELNYLLFALISFMTMFLSLWIESFYYIFFWFFGTATGYLISNIFFKLKFWGGADAKILISISAAMPYLIEFTFLKHLEIINFIDMILATMFFDLIFLLIAFVAARIYLLISRKRKFAFFPLMFVSFILFILLF